MPRQQLSADQIQDEAEALFLEQAKAYFRDLRQAAQNLSKQNQSHLRTVNEVL